ncbi:MAG: hypothetical protein ACAI44_37770 [Candidatus Sericytochromatia bacterium]
MSNLSVSAKVDTPFQKLASSTPAKFVKDNPVLAGSAAVGAGIIAKNVADHSDIAATVIKKGAVPLLGGSAVLLGASMVHDAFKQGAKAFGSDDKEAKSQRVAELGKGLGGAALVVAGAELVARPFGASPLRALGRAIDTPVGIATSLALPGLGAATWGVMSIKSDGLSVGNAAAVGLGTTWATAQGVLLANGYGSPAVQNIAEKSLGVVGGAGLGLGAVALGKKAYEEVQEKNWTSAALYAGGATAAGVASAHILGNASGVAALSNLAGKAFHNPLLAGSIAVVGLTGVAYVAYSHQKDAEAQTKPETKPDSDHQAPAQAVHKPHEK